MSKSITKPKPKHINKIDYGINIWNPDFGFMKNTTKDTETPGEIVIESQFKNSFWKKLTLDSRYYFNPQEVNLAKMIYGQMVYDNKKYYSELERETQNNKTFTMDISELLKTHFTDLSQNELKQKKKDIKKTIKKLAKLQIELYGELEDGTKINKFTSFIIEPEVVSNDQKGSLRLSYRLSEWFDVERALNGDKRGITTDFLVYQNIETNFGAQIHKLTKYEQTILTHFKTIFDFKSNQKSIIFNVRNNLSEIVTNWNELKAPTRRQYMGAYVGAFARIEENEIFGKHFKCIGMGDSYEITRF
jgi:hypothetical protein